MAGPPVPTAAAALRRRARPVPHQLAPTGRRCGRPRSCAVPPPRRDDRDRRPGTGRHRPGRWHAALPGLRRTAAALGARAQRTVRDRGTATLVLRPRRARCPACRATHVLLPALVAPWRADTTAGIGAALQASAAGAGYRRIAAQLDRLASTVRRWPHRVAARAAVGWIARVDRVLLLGGRTPAVDILGHGLTPSPRSGTDSFRRSSWRPGTLIGLSQAITLGDHTRRWMGWFAANLTIYLLAAVAYSPAKWALDALALSTQITPALPSSWVIGSTGSECCG